MNYNELVSTVSTILENDKINKNGLTLLYELSEVDLRNINEELFYLDTENEFKVFVPEDEFDVEIWDILIKFKKKL